MKTIINRMVNFFSSHRMFNMRSGGPSFRMLLLQQLRVVYLSFKGFRQDNCVLRASALTYYTVLSFVPVLAMAFGIAKGFGFEKLLENELYQRFSGQEEVIAKIITFAQALLEKTKGGVIAGIGVAFLLWTVVKVLSNIESSFNAIWRVKQERELKRKFSDYLNIMLIAPVLVLLHGSMSVYISVQVTMLTQNVAFIGYFSPVIFTLLKLLPYALIWLLLSFLYAVMPNTRVKLHAAVFAGILAGTIYNFVQWAYINFQIGVSQSNAIYGSFAAFPLFLIWLQVSWLIVLFGAEIAFYLQNMEKYKFDGEIQRISFYDKTVLSLAATGLLVNHFAEGKPPLTADDVGRSLLIPYRVAQEILENLIYAGLASAVNDPERSEESYQPSLDIQRYTVGFVIEALEKNGTNRIPVGETQQIQKMNEILEKYKDIANASDANRLLKEI